MTLFLWHHHVVRCLMTNRDHHHRRLLTTDSDYPAFRSRINTHPRPQSRCEITRERMGSVSQISENELESAEERRHGYSLAGKFRRCLTIGHAWQSSYANSIELINLEVNNYPLKLRQTINTFISLSLFFFFYSRSYYSISSLLPPLSNDNTNNNGPHTIANSVKYETEPENCLPHSTRHPSGMISHIKRSIPDLRSYKHHQLLENAGKSQIQFTTHSTVQSQCCSCVRVILCAIYLTAICITHSSTTTFCSTLVL